SSTWAAAPPMSSATRSPPRSSRNGKANWARRGPERTACAKAGRGLSRSLEHQGTAMSYRLHVNGQVHTVDVPGDMPLLWVLRESLGLVGTKFGCGQALCGACTVHVDGVAQRSCQLPVSGVGEGRITTIEHVGTTPIGARLQAAWLEI